MPLHCKVSVQPDGDATRVTLDWIDVDESQQPGTVQFSEEFRLPLGSGSSYVSRVEFVDGQVLPGTFWLDVAGKRHFVLEADTGVMSLFGSMANADRGTV